MLLDYLEKLKVQICCTSEEICKQNALIFCMHPIIYLFIFQFLVSDKYFLKLPDGLCKHWQG